MAWNKSVQPIETKAVPLGAPVTTFVGNLDRGYHDGWDIERLYRDGVKKVTWVYRCIDAIAGNQARLPMMAREDNNPNGKVVDDAEGLKLLNQRSNPGEDSYAFRYRLSAQLLTSTRGAFVEVLRGRDGRPTALHLLPPQYTSPIPDPKKFVKGFEVLLPGYQRQILRPENVLWFKHPHPLDPYLSMTPLESAGIAVEIETLAKFYNRAFLLNDGRPGGLLVVRGDMDDSDKQELQMRFRGNLAQSGSVSVIASEDGVDFVDTGANPRDAAYIQMRQITKEEILSSFGVPESVIGNAAGRTFSNAVEETRVFWLETMPQHLEMLARGFDALHDDYWFDFDTSEVPVLMIAEQERHRYLMQEFQTGLITANEYRDGTGRGKVESELADSMLANPNLAPIGNTEKPTPPQSAAGGMPPAGPEGMPPAGPEGMPPAPPMPGSDIPEGQVAMANGETMARPRGEPTPEFELSAEGDGLRVKSASPETSELDHWDVKAETDADRWVEIMDTSLERLFERQQRVVLEKANGAKAKKSLMSGELSVDQIFDEEVWNKQMREDLRPLLTAIVRDAMETGSQQSGMPVEADTEEVEQYIDEQMDRVEQANSTTKEEITAALVTALALAGEDEDSHPLLKTAILAIFLHLLSKRRRKIAEHEAQAAYNAGVWFAGKQTGVPTKTWVTRRDSRVRPQHAFLNGTTVDLEDGFKAGGHVLRFPGDPLAPPSLTIGCRCRLRFGRQ